MRTGVQTTEFWITMVITFMNALIQGGVLPGDLPNVEIAALLTNGVVVVAYIISRFVVKRAESENSG